MSYWRSPSGIIGDGPADVMGEAIDAVREHYRADVHREPTKSEIRDVVAFVLAPLDELVDNGAGKGCQSHGST